MMAEGKWRRYLEEIFEFSRAERGLGDRKSSGHYWSFGAVAHFGSIWLLKEGAREAAADGSTVGGMADKRMHDA